MVIVDFYLFKGGFVVDEGGEIVYFSERSPREVSETEVRSLLHKIKNGDISGFGYIPVRISTPGIVQERLFSRDNPMVMPVDKAYQAMSEIIRVSKGKKLRGHKLSVDDLIEIIKRMDSPDYLFVQPENDRGVEVIKYRTPEGNIAVIVEFGDNVDAVYMNGYKGGTYNVAITAFEVDGSMVGLFQYARDKQWVEVFNKEKEGDPAKKVPATRPFAIEQIPLMDIISEKE